MMFGSVNLLCEDTLPIVVGNASKKQQFISAVIDTGFNGYLTLPSEIITALELPWNCTDIVTLGDGSETLFDLNSATVIWNGQFREIDIAESETEPLIGMSLLHGYRLLIDVIQSGTVTIEALPNSHK